MSNHWISLYSRHKLDSALLKTDIYVRDKQNVDAAIRILKPQVRSCLSSDQKTIATQIYFKMGEDLLNAYTMKDLPVEKRVFLARVPVLLFR